MFDNASAVNGVNLKLLQTFLLVAENNSFGRAAEHVNRSQSAVSSQIKQLENQLGVTLFYRTTRHVQLTLDGERLLGSARRAMKDLSITLRKLRDAGEINRRKVSIACSPMIAMTQLGSVLAAFERDYPRVQISVRELPSYELQKVVRTGEVDFGVGPLLRDADLTFDLILDDELYAVIPRKLLNEPGENIRLRDVAALPVLMPQPGTVMRSFLDEVLTSCALEPSANHEFTMGQSLVSMAEAGLGVAILPAYGIPNYLLKDVVIARIIEPTMSRQMAIVSLRGNPMSEHALRLAELIRQQLGVGRSETGLPKIPNERTR